MSQITLFSTPKPFVDPHISMIQKNAIKSWIALGDQVEIFLIGEETGVKEVAAEFGVRYFPEVKRNAQGTPLVSSIFQIAHANSSSELLAYINADIILFEDFVKSAKIISDLYKEFLLVGQRWDLDVTHDVDFKANWQLKLQKELRNSGKLHPRGGSDYFIYPKTCFKDIPEFAIGRAGWDNWMFFEARTKHWPLIDTTESIQIIHQQHDYRHLPNGQPHYRLPESDVNMKLAGGEIAIFNLIDTDRRLCDGKIRPPKLSIGKILREIEIFPLVHLKSKKLGWLFYALFHPRWGYWYIRKFFGKVLKRK